jgi:hypothetical protein
MRAATRDHEDAGAYQMGDVQARSCVVIGTSFPIFTLKYAAS